MESPFIAEIDADGFVSMRLTGTLSIENFEELKTSVENAKQMVKKYSDERHGQVKALFDLSNFTGVYNVGAMTAMKDLADHNRPYLSRSAVFGGSDLARVAADVTIAFIGDPTIKLFKTREEAVEWLKR